VVDRGQVERAIVELGVVVFVVLRLGDCRGAVDWEVGWGRGGLGCCRLGGAWDRGSAPI
jgi:hypothetical protein